MLCRARGKSERPAGTAGLHQTFHAWAMLSPLFQVRAVTYVSGMNRNPCPERTQENLERAKGFEPSTPTLAR